MKHLKLFEAYLEDAVHVNIWDDYRQEPEYDTTEDTYLFVEEGDFSQSMVSDVIKQISEWINDNVKLDGVDYKIVTAAHGNTADGFEPRERLQISNLDTEKREALLKQLQDAKMHFTDTPIVFYSES